MNSIGFYTKKRIKKRESFFQKKVNFKGVDTTDLLITKIVKHLASNNKVLDIGTGNGFVPLKLNERLRDKPIELWGVDISDEMIKKARANVADTSNINIVKGDNFDLPFQNEFFDVVTNKVVTNFSCEEVFRVLRKGGYFIFKEYGQYKGLKEITKLFNTRVIRRRVPEDYVIKLKKAGFKRVSLKEFEVKYRYSFNDLINVLEMAPIIENFSAKDKRTIKEAIFKSKKNIWITADPFIIIAKK